MGNGGKIMSKQCHTIYVAAEGDAMAYRSMSKPSILLAAFLATAVAQQPKPVLPMIAAGAIPLYPPLARAAKVQGVVRLKVVTDGTRVATA